MSEGGHRQLCGYVGNYRKIGSYVYRGTIVEKVSDQVNVVKYAERWAIVEKVGNYEERWAISGQL